MHTVSEPNVPELHMAKSLTFLAVVMSGFLPFSHGAASADEIRVLSAVGMRQVLAELVPRFERSTGLRVHLAFDSGATIARRIEAGEAAMAIDIGDTVTIRRLNK